MDLSLLDVKKLQGERTAQFSASVCTVNGATT